MKLSKYSPVAKGSASHKPEGTGTKFTKNGMLRSDNRPKPGEKQRDERMLDGLRELTAVWGKKSCD